MSAQENGGVPDLSALVGSLLSNPSAMAMLSSLLAGKMGGESAASGGAGDTGAANERPALPVMSPVHTRPPQEERAALVAALRPFLSPEKCEMIDNLLRIMDLLFLLRGRRQ